MPEGPTFGALLRRYRQRAGLTHEALAERAGTSASGIAALERGRRQRPYPHTVRSLTEALGLSPEERAAFAALASPPDVRADPPEAVTRELKGADRPATPTNLPVPRTALIGRDNDVAGLVDLLAGAETRLVTLTGVGGVGKTRVALQAAADVRSRPGVFPDGIWLVELAPVTDPALVPHLTATVLGVHEAPKVAVLDSLVAALQSRALLLVLDNCEHLVDACAHLAEQLLAACPRLHLLATSREPLQIAGEYQRRVAPLEVPDPGELGSVDDLTRNPAVRLFVSRAQAAAATFHLTTDNAAAVAQVCVRLDGIPLALELAAARAPALAVEQILARLDDSLRLLTGGSRAGPTRQQTLRGALDWSHALLTAPEQAAFRRLAAFAGGFDLEAAEAVCAGDGLATEDVLDALLQLVGKSLVVAESGSSGAGRYRLLEPLRQYAVERLEASGEAAVVRGRHQDWFLVLVEAAAPKLQGPEQSAWLARLAREHDNLRAALRWSVERGAAEPGLRIATVLGAVGARGGLWYLNGHLSEGRAWLEALLNLPELALRSAPRARALAAAGNLATFRGDHAAALALAEEALAIFREVNDREGVAEALYVLSTPLWWQGDYAAARAALTESLAIFRESGDRQLASITLSVLGHLAFAAGDLAAARALSTEALVAQRELHHIVGIQFSLHNLGEVAQAEDNLAEARDCYAESLEITRQTGQADGLGMSLFHLGDVAVDQGDLAAAHTWFADSLRIYRRTGSTRRQATVLDGVAGLAAASGAASRALRLAGAVAAFREATGLRNMPPLQARLERRLVPARAALSREAQAAAWAAGAAMSLDDAIADVLDAADDEYVGTVERLRTRPFPPEELGPARPVRPDPSPRVGAADERSWASPRARTAGLTPREWEVLALLVEGSSNRAVADRLLISTHTVVRHVANILTKLEATSRGQAVALTLGVEAALADQNFERAGEAPRSR
jgi:non-specific serine/threonine protein kinase